MEKKITSLAQVREHKNILQIKFQVSECPNFVWHFLFFEGFPYHKFHHYYHIVQLSDFSI